MSEATSIPDALTATHDAPADTAPSPVPPQPVRQAVSVGAAARTDVLGAPGSVVGRGGGGGSELAKTVAEAKDGSIIFLKDAADQIEVDGLLGQLNKQCSVVIDPKQGVRCLWRNRR